MNERINNLRLDAGISQLKDDPRLVVIDREGNVIEPLVGLEKFARLIVKECRKVIEEDMDANPDDEEFNFWMDHARQIIGEHIGVEE